MSLNGTWHWRTCHLCTGIATEIYPHIKDISPGGVKDMTALDPELSEEALAVKVRWFEKILERLLTLQSYSVWPSFRHCAVSNFMPSTFLLSKLERPMLHRLFLQSYLYQCQLCLLLLRHFVGGPFDSIGENPTDQQQIWKFCIQETWHRRKLLHQKEPVDAFDENEKTRA